MDITEVASLMWLSYENATTELSYGRLTHKAWENEPESVRDLWLRAAEYFVEKWEV